MGQYVVPSEYSHTAREKRKKKANKEGDYAEEQVRMVARILESEAELMNYKRVHEVATKGEIVDKRRSRVKWLLKAWTRRIILMTMTKKEGNRQVL